MELLRIAAEAEDKERSERRFKMDTVPATPAPTASTGRRFLGVQISFPTSNGGGNNGNGGNLQTATPLRNVRPNGSTEVR